MASPVFNGTERVGVLVFQLPISQINAIMQERSGMGETGETYLVGADKLMRSDSLFSQESTLFSQLVDTVTANKALDGQTGFDITPGYRGTTVLSAYKPTDIQSVDWAILAEVDESEGFAAVKRILTLVLAVISVAALIVAVIAFVIARSIANPLRVVTRAATKLEEEHLPQLVQTYRAVAAGYLTASVQIETEHVNVRSRDEVGTMAQAFNQMNGALGEVGTAFAKMTANLREMMGRIQRGANGVAAASEQLNSAAEQSGSATQQVTQTIQQVADGTNQQIELVTEASSNVKQMARGADGIANGAQEQSESVQIASVLIEEMATLVGQIEDGALNIGEAGEKMSDAVH